MKKLSKLFLLLLVPVFSGISCQNDNNNTGDPAITAVNKGIYDLMKEVYLWNDQLPASIDPSAYATPNDFMEALRYDVYDRWSTVLTKDEYNSYFVEGQMIGHGFMLGLDALGNI